MENNQFAPGPSGAGSSGEIEIDLMKLLGALWRNILVIVLAALIGGAAMLAYTWFLTKPAYTASVLAYINKSSVSISGAELLLSNGEDVLATYTTILNSRTTLEEVAQTAGLPYDAETLGKMISTTNTSAAKASFMTVEVTSTSPVEAELIANTIATVLPTRVADIVEGSTLRVVDYAVIPSSRSTDSLVRNFAIGVLGAAFAVCAVIALTTVIRTNHAPLIASSSDLAQFYPEYPVLGVIRDLSYSDKKFKYSDYGYGKYSEYYSKPNEEASDSGRRKTSGSSGTHRSAKTVRSAKAAAVNEEEVDDQWQ